MNTLVLKQFADQFQGGTLIPAFLHQHIQNFAFVIDSTPQKHSLPTNPHHHLVEMPAGRRYTSVAAKPIAAIMTKTASASGYQLGLLAAAGALTLIPGAVVIYFVRNYIAKGFALGRV